MGLDMYLTGKFFIWHDSDREKLRQFLGQPVYHHTSKHDQPVEALPKPEPLINTNLIPEYIEFEVMYWRKANQIHAWFVKNVQDGEDDCRTYYVSNEKLQELVAQCKKALAAKNPEEVLPTQEGFFFGSTEYDEYYREDLRNTIEKLEAYLKSPEAQELSLHYHSSW